MSVTPTMTDKITLTRRQHHFLTEVARHVHNVYRAADALDSAASDIRKHLALGGVTTWGLSHQTPKDLWQAEGQLQVARERAIQAGIAPSLVTAIIATADDDARWDILSSIKRVDSAPISEEEIASLIEGFNLSSGERQDIAQRIHQAIREKDLA